MIRPGRQGDGTMRLAVTIFAVMAGLAGAAAQEPDFVPDCTFSDAVYSDGSGWSMTFKGDEEFMLQPTLRHPKDDGGFSGTIIVPVNISQTMFTLDSWCGSEDGKNCGYDTPLLALFHVGGELYADTPMAFVDAPPPPMLVTPALAVTIYSQVVKWGEPGMGEADEYPGALWKYESCEKG